MLAERDILEHRGQGGAYARLERGLVETPEHCLASDAEVLTIAWWCCPCGIFPPLVGIGAGTASHGDPLARPRIRSMSH